MKISRDDCARLLSFPDWTVKNLGPQVIRDLFVESVEWIDGAVRIQTWHGSYETRVDQISAYFSLEGRLTIMEFRKLCNSPRSGSIHVAGLELFTVNLDARGELDRIMRATGQYPAAIQPRPL